MKKLFSLSFLLLMLLSAGKSFAENINGDIIFNEPDYNTKITLIPLEGVWSKGNSVTLGAGGSFDYVSDSIFALNAAGSVSYYCASLKDVDSDEIDEYTSKYMTLEGGATFLFYNKVTTKDSPATIGSRMSGNTKTYYMLDVPLKQRVAVGVRGGVKYSKFEEEWEIEYVKYETKTDGYEIYAGINSYMLGHIIFDLSDDFMAKSFGKRHESYFVHNMYLDVLYNPDKDIESTGKKFGWRLGYNGNNEGFLNARIEGGKSTFLGWNLSISCGVALCL